MKVKYMVVPAFSRKMLPPAVTLSVFGVVPYEVLILIVLIGSSQHGQIGAGLLLLIFLEL